MPRRNADLGRFSDPSLLILSSLAAGPKHGYAMILDIEAFSGTRLEPGTLYGAIAGAVLVNYAKTYLTGAFPEVWLYALGALFVCSVDSTR